VVLIKNAKDNKGLWSTEKENRRKSDLY